MTSKVKRAAFFAVVVIGALWAMRGFYDPPKLEVATWPSVDGGFVQYGIGDDTASFLLLSELGTDALVQKIAARRGWKSRTLVLLLAANGEKPTEVVLGESPTLAVTDETGKVVHAEWKIDHGRFQKFLEDLRKMVPAEKQQPSDSLGFASDLLRAFGPGAVPAAILDVLGER